MQPIISLAIAASLTVALTGAARADETGLGMAGPVVIAGDVQVSATGFGGSGGSGGTSIFARVAGGL